MKRMIGFTGSLMLLFLLLTSVILPSLPKADAGSSDKNTGKVFSAEVSQEEEYKFIVKESGGKVAVFRKGEEKPFYVSKARVSDLPEQDAAMLQSGIKIYGRQELDRALEDFCS